MMRLALYQPDIPQNTGSLLRLSACLGFAVDIIEPCGFVFSDRRIRRAGMDYLDHAAVTHHTSWATFLEAKGLKRLILLTPQAELPYFNFKFQKQDVILVGQESIGVPEEVYHATDAQLCIPMQKGYRSINVALAAAMVIGEVFCQTGQFKS